MTEFKVTTEYFYHYDKDDFTMHSCPNCNSSEHILTKTGIYVCPFCGRFWKNIRVKVDTPQKTEAEIWTEYFDKCQHELDIYIIFENKFKKERDEAIRQLRASEMKE